jgi:hypothetical protein
MAKQPKRAIAAFLAADVDIGGVTVRAITLATIAILEEIDSYLFRDGTVRAADRIPTLYVMTRKAAESIAHLNAGGVAALNAAAWAWAETIPASLWPRLVRAAEESARRVTDVAPSTGSADDGDGVGNG